MGWAEHYRRRDALNGVLERGELSVPEPFTGPTEVLLALHHRWSLQLVGRLELAETAADRVDAAGKAWREAAAANPRLLALLDAHAGHPPLRALIRAEHRLLARAAGLTGPTDGRLEQAAIGAAFVELLRNGPQERGNRVERLLRRLVASG